MLFRSWLWLVAGILWLILGFIVLSLRPASITACVILISIAFWLGGLTQLALAFVLEGGFRWLAIIGGTLALIAGIVAIVWPEPSEKSVIDMVGQDFPRLRIGVGRGNEKWDLSDHVLARFSADERPTIERAIKRAADAVETFVGDGVLEAMNRYNAPEEAANNLKAEN